MSLEELMPLLREMVDASSNDISSSIHVASGSQENRAKVLSDLNRAKASVLSAGFD